MTTKHRPLKLISLSRERALTEQMKSRGMPRDLLRQPPFDPRYYTLSIRCEMEGYKVRKVTKAKQLQHLDTIVNNPLGDNYLFVIASNPTDAKGNLVAAMIMERVFSLPMRERTPAGREAVKWHRVYGGFGDPLRDAITRESEGKMNPAMLILSNVTTESTAVKLETVRDLLVHYDAIPRILICSGTDPMTFARRYLRMNFSHCLNLSTAHRVEL